MFNFISVFLWIFVREQKVGVLSPMRDLCWLTRLSSEELQLVGIIVLHIISCTLYSLIDWISTFH